MPPEPHNFHPYFTLVKNTINKGNAFAVCNSYINNCDGGLEEAKLRPECYTSNKAKLCRAHLAKCENFKKTFSEEEIKEILKLPVPEDKVDDIIEVDDDESIQNLAKRRRLSTLTVSSFNSVGSQQNH